jgi:hypothetical protein
LDKTAIYHKSPRGAEAIATRNAALTPKLRSMLILVDGRRPYAELAKLAAGLGDPDWLLEQLEGEGFIEAGPARAGSPTAPAPLQAASAPAPLRPASAPAPLRPASAPAPLAPTELNVPLDHAQRFAVQRLTDLLGPTGQDLCMRIEATRSAKEFRAVIRRTETMLREVVGPELAARFVSEVESQRPS